MEDFEVPPASGPISLEHYVKYKPNSRKDRRGSKLPVPPNYHDGFNAEANRTLEHVSKSLIEVPRSNIQMILDEGLEEKPKVPAAILHNRLSTDFPNFTESALDTLFDYPSVGPLPRSRTGFINMAKDVSDSTGPLRRARHLNGDISVFQWSAPTFCWIYVGRIPYKRVDQFCTFLNVRIHLSSFQFANLHRISTVIVSTLT